MRSDANDLLAMLATESVVRFVSDILLSRTGSIATVTLSNPGKLNALDIAMWQKLATCFDALSADLSLRCVIVCGENGQFAAGADIEEFATVRSTLEQGIRYHTVAIGAALAAISDCVHPVIAAIEGVCIGGGLEIACACDLRIASSAARFGIPINRLGFALAPGEMPALLHDTVGEDGKLVFSSLVHRLA